MLTTIDNPFSPFTQFDEWYAYDTNNGYNSSALLARVIRTSDELSDADQSLAIEEAVDFVVSEDPLGIYKKVTKDATPSSS